MGLNPFRFVLVDPLAARCAPYPLLGALNEQCHSPGCYRGSTLPVKPGAKNSQMMT
jgi:hypothetical protein